MVCGPPQTGCPVLCPSCQCLLFPFHRLHSPQESTTQISTATAAFALIFCGHSGPPLSPSPKVGPPFPSGRPLSPDGSACLEVLTRHGFPLTKERDRPWLLRLCDVMVRKGRFNYSIAYWVCDLWPFYGECCVGSNHLGLFVTGPVTLRAVVQRPLLSFPVVVQAVNIAQVRRALLSAGVLIGHSCSGNSCSLSGFRLTHYTKQAFVCIVYFESGNSLVTLNLFH